MLYFPEKSIFLPFLSLDIVLVSFLSMSRRSFEVAVLMGGSLLVLLEKLCAWNSLFLGFVFPDAYGLKLLKFVFELRLLVDTTV